MELPEIIGLPPSTHVSDNLIKASMPIAEFVPCKPKFQEGVTLFKVINDSSTYKSILQNYGFETATPIKVAFTAENFPSEQFSNEYGQNFLSRMGNAVTGGLRDVSQIAGGRSAPDLAKDLKNKLTGEDAGKISNMIGGALGAVGGGLKSAFETGAGVLPGVNAQEAEAMAERMLSGARIDFPQTWKNSGFQTSYTLNVRLYNPNPANENATKKYMTGPLAALLTLGLPRSKGLGTFTWPFFQKVRCKGLFKLDPGVITNISVVKGGDQQQIAYNQRPTIIDVRIELGSLYSSLIINEEGKELENRPSLKTYIKNLDEKKDVSNAHHAIVGEVNLPEIETSYASASGTGRQNPNEPTASRVSSRVKDTTASLIAYA